MPRRARRAPSRSACAGRALRTARIAPQPRIHHGGSADARPRHRRDHRYLLGGVRRTASAAALCGPGPRYGVARNKSARRKRECFVPELSRLAPAEPCLFGNGPRDRHQFFVCDGRRRSGDHRGPGGVVELPFAAGRAPGDGARFRRLRGQGRGYGGSDRELRILAIAIGRADERAGTIHPHEQPELHGDRRTAAGVPLD